MQVQSDPKADNKLPLEHCTAGSSMTVPAYGTVYMILSMVPVADKIVCSLVSRRINIITWTRLQKLPRTCKPCPHFTVTSHAGLCAHQQCFVFGSLCSLMFCLFARPTFTLYLFASLCGLSCGTGQCKACCHTIAKSIL